MKTALITGYTGQDGTLLAKYLLSLDYRVIGLVRRISTEPPLRVRGNYDFSEYIKSGQLILWPGDMESLASLIVCFDRHHVDEVYNLAAQSHVGISFWQPDLTSMVDYMGVVNLTTAMQTTHTLAKLYQASSSEMYGTGVDRPINEATPLNPNSPYAIAKAAAHFYIRSLRDRGWFACSGILFNHESEIRGGDFVTQKIARAAATGEELVLGNLDAQRDWGYAGDYVRAMHLMMQQDTPDDFVIGTGKSHSVREFVEAAYAAAGKPTPEVTIDPSNIRPLDVSHLQANPTKARVVLGWRPTIGFEALVKLMVENQEKLYANNN